MGSGTDKQDNFTLSRCTPSTMAQLKYLSLQPSRSLSCPALAVPGWIFYWGDSLLSCHCQNNPTSLQVLQVNPVVLRCIHRKFPHADKHKSFHVSTACSDIHTPPTLNTHTIHKVATQHTLKAVYQKCQCVHARPLWVNLVSPKLTQSLTNKSTYTPLNFPVSCLMSGSPQLVFVLTILFNKAKQCFPLVIKKQVSVDFIWLTFALWPLVESIRCILSTIFLDLLLLKLKSTNIKGDHAHWPAHCPP